MTAGTPNTFREIYSRADANTQRQMRAVWEDVHSTSATAAFVGGLQASRDNTRSTVRAKAREYFKRTYQNANGWSPEQIDQAIAAGARINIYDQNGAVVGSAVASAWIERETERASTVQTFLTDKLSFLSLGGYSHTEEDINAMRAAFQTGLTGATGSVASTVLNGNFSGIWGAVTGAVGGLVSSVVGLIPGVKQGLMTAGIFALSLFSPQKKSLAESWQIAGAHLSAGRVHGNTTLPGTAGNSFDRGRLNALLASAIAPGWHGNAALDSQFENFLNQNLAAPPGMTPGVVPTDGLDTAPAAHIPAHSRINMLPGMAGGPIAGSPYVPTITLPSGATMGPVGVATPAQIANRLSDQLQLPAVANGGNIEISIPGAANAVRTALNGVLTRGGITSVAFGGTDNEKITLTTDQARELTRLLQLPANAPIVAQLRSVAGVPPAVKEAYATSLATRISTQFRTTATRVGNTVKITAMNPAMADNFRTAVRRHNPTLAAGLGTVGSADIIMTTETAAQLSALWESLTLAGRAELEGNLPRAGGAPPAAAPIPVPVGMAPIAMDLLWVGRPAVGGVAAPRPLHTDDTNDFHLNSVTLGPSTVVGRQAVTSVSVRGVSDDLTYTLRALGAAPAAVTVSDAEAITLRTGTDAARRLIFNRIATEMQAPARRVIAIRDHDAAGAVIPLPPLVAVSAALPRLPGVVAGNQPISPTP